MEHILEVRGLTKQYSSFLLDNVTFSVPSGSIVGFVGENGAGKTTTIKLILNEVRRNAGSVRVFGLDNLRGERKIKEQIGAVFDESYFHGEFRAGDVGAILKRVFRSWDETLFQSSLQRFRLPPGKPVKEYSRGMKMKLSIASALAHRPRLLILDEATSGLDPIARSEILDLLLDFIQDETHGVLFSSHITNDLERVADYVVFLHEGKVVFERPKDDLTDRFGIIRCGAADLKRIASGDCVRKYKTGFECSALVEDRAAAKRKYPDLLVDRASIDDIMLFYAKGERP